MCRQLTSACAVQGTASKFHAYLQTLPQEHDCILCWSKGQLSELEGSHPPKLLIHLSITNSHCVGQLCGSKHHANMHFCSGVVAL